jgi:pilus assembly protein CpaE
MSVINPNETARSWQTNKREAAVHLYLSGAEGNAAILVGARAAGFPLALSLVSPSGPIDSEELSAAAAAVVQVDQDSATSIKRFEQLAKATETPLIAAAFDPPLAFVRSLVRAGAHDVVPLPLDLADLETSLAPIRDQVATKEHTGKSTSGKVVSFIKSSGGIGATAMLSQLAITFAQNERAARREACLIDLDIQFGNAAFQLGLTPTHSIVDLVEAGPRLDPDLLRATTSLHPSGLHVIASPPDMMPLDALSSEHLIEIVELAAREFGTVFLDLPSNWTNWSLSLLARSDLVLLVTELSISDLQRARRQLELISAQDLDQLNLRVVVNRFEKGVLRTIKPADLRKALGRDISYTLSNDSAVVRAAVARGVPIDEVKRKSAVGRDIDTLDAGVAAALGLKR